MPTQVQFRRGTAAQNNSFTGAAGELSINSDNNSLRVHDGTTDGGYELAKADLSNTSGISSLSLQNLNVTGISTLQGLLNVGVAGTIITATTAGKIGITSTIPGYTLDVGGIINSSTDVRIGGISVLTTSSNDALALAIALG
jgi:hypothetical protein